MMVGMLAIGCGPSPGTSHASAGAEGDGSTGPEGSDGGAAQDSSSADAETGTSPEACVLADPAACPDDCYLGSALRVLDDACTTESVEVCLPGGPKPGLPDTTFWALTADGPVFAEYGGNDCSAGAQPQAWAECSGAADEPEACACFCQQDYCPGDADRRALDQCGLPTPCDALFIDPRFGVASHDDERCVLEALRDRVPGNYEMILGSAASSERVRFYAFGEALSRIEQHADDFITCPKVSDWSRASRCTLAPASYFTGCLEGAAPGEDCVLDLDAWALDCVEQPPAC